MPMIPLTSTWSVWPAGHFLRFLGAALVAALALLSGCGSAPPPAAPAGEHSLEQAVKRSVAHLVALAEPARAASPTPPRLFVTPTTDTFAGAELQEAGRVMALLRQHLQTVQPPFNLAPAGPREGLATDDWRLDSRLFAEPGATPGRFQLELRLIKHATSEVLARSGARVVQEGVNLATLAPTPPPKPAEPQVPAVVPPTAAQVAHANAQLERAQAAYAAGRLNDALVQYGQVAKLPGADVLKARVGEYVTLNRLGRKVQAEAVFSQIVTLGLQARALSVKLLFAPRGTEYWPDAAVSGPYPAWLKEIARQATGMTDCLAVVGHSSRSGGELARMKTSLERARVVGAQLIKEVPALAQRLRYIGMGSKEAVVGTGADDASDAVDRRVEFRVVPCQ
jgi:outer membrane protein OmpA-like peptidoglycan-associated protein